jgi:hypothetical protein
VLHGKMVEEGLNGEFIAIGVADTDWDSSEYPAARIRAVLHHQGDR